MRWRTSPPHPPACPPLDTCRMLLVAGDCFGEVAYFTDVAQASTITTLDTVGGRGGQGPGLHHHDPRHGGGKGGAGARPPPSRPSTRWGGGGGRGQASTITTLDTVGGGTSLSWGRHGRGAQGVRGLAELGLTWQGGTGGMGLR